MNGRTRRSDSAAQIDRRRFLASAAWTAEGVVATGAGSWVIPAASSWATDPIKVGIATDLTGALGFCGKSNLNAAKLCASLIDKSGGLLGRPVRLFVEDTASNEAVAVANVRRLIERDHVDVVLGGIASSMRNAIKGPIVARGHTLYIYPEFYEGQECERLIYCTGPTPPQLCDRLIPWLIKNGGKRFALPGSNYIAPHLMNKYAPQPGRKRRRRGDIRGVLPGSADRLRRHGQQDHDRPDQRRLCERGPAGGRTVLQAALRGRISQARRPSLPARL